MAGLVKEHRVHPRRLKAVHRRWALLAAAAAIGLAGCAQPAEPQEQDVPAAIVRRSDIVVEITASGRVEPHTRADLAFEGSGKVAEVLVQEGSVVRAGDEVARLETEALELQVEQAKAALASAQARRR